MTDISTGGDSPAGGMGTSPYRRKQTGSLMTVIVMAGLACIFMLMKQKGIQRVLVFYLIVLGFAALIFSSMMVVVEGSLLTIKFGLGIVWKRINLLEVESCRIVKNPWYYGWGIRRIRGGWYFGVSGLSAVELTMKSGKRFRIGTDVPEELEAVILARGSNIRQE